jgi:hypothetical protein
LASGQKQVPGWCIIEALASISVVNAAKIRKESRYYMRVVTLTGGPSSFNTKIGAGALVE